MFMSNVRVICLSHNLEELELEAEETMKQIQELRKRLHESSLYDIAELKRLNDLYISIKQRISELRG